MAEFLEVMKNWERMCDSCHEYCELFDKLCPSVQNILLNFDENDAATIERVVTKWARENPEPPVYPTWREYVMSLLSIDDKGNDRIPEDIAKILKIDPVNSQSEHTP